MDKHQIIIITALVTITVVMVVYVFTALKK